MRLNFPQMHLGLKFLPFYPRIYFTVDDWDVITSNGKITDEENLLAVEPFIVVIDQVTQKSPNNSKRTLHKSPINTRV